MEIVTRLAIAYHASWVISMMAVLSEYFTFIDFDSILKEYKTLTLIYNRQTYRLDSLCVCVSEDIILLAIRPGIKQFEVERCLNTCLEGGGEIPQNSNCKQLKQHLELNNIPLGTS